MGLNKHLLYFRIGRALIIIFAAILCISSKCRGELVSLSSNLHPIIFLGVTNKKGITGRGNNTLVRIANVFPSRSRSSVFQTAISGANGLIVLLTTIRRGRRRWERTGRRGSLAISSLPASAVVFSLSYGGSAVNHLEVSTRRRCSSRKAPQDAEKSHHSKAGRHSMKRQCHCAARD